MGDISHNKLNLTDLQIIVKAISELHIVNLAVNIDESWLENTLERPRTWTSLFRDPAPTSIYRELFWKKKKRSPIWKSLKHFTMYEGHDTKSKENARQLADELTEHGANFKRHRPNELAIVEEDGQ